MITEKLKFEEIVELGEKRLQTFVDNARGNVCLEIHLASVNCTQNPLDIARDYLEALFVGEKLLPYTRNIVERKRRNDYWVYIDFEMDISDAAGWCKTAVWLARGLLLEDEDDEIDVFGEIEDFEDSIFEIELRFPELADDYLANFLHGSFDDENYLRSFYKRFPTWRHTFWKSFLSRGLGFDFYVSPYAWFVPSSADVNDLLAKHGGYSDPSLYQLRPAERFVDKCKLMAFNPTSMIEVPQDELRDALSCAKVLGHKNDQRNAAFLLSDAGTVFGYCSAGLNFIFFCDDRLKVSAEAGRRIITEVDDVSRKLRALFGPIEAKFDWRWLNDDLFEELCYDVLLRYGRYDSGTIRKMGKSRSRDGGRDLQVMSPERPGKSSTKWIVQCKFTKGGRSLSGSQVTVADVIDQYGAGGFSVMTNGLIDSTLYDKVDAIAARRGVEVKLWSGLELERFLQDHPDLFRKYFRGHGPST